VLAAVQLPQSHLMKLHIYTKSVKPIVMRAAVMPFKYYT